MEKRYKELSEKNRRMKIEEELYKQLGEVKEK